MRFFLSFGAMAVMISILASPSWARESGVANPIDFNHLPEGPTAPPLDFNKLKPRPPISHRKKHPAPAPSFPGYEEGHCHPRAFDSYCD